MGVPVVKGGQNLPPMIGIGITEPPNIGGGGGGSGPLPPSLGITVLYPTNSRLAIEQGCRKLCKSVGARTNVEGIICP